MRHVVGRISFFLNAGVRFVEEVAKVRALTALWDELCRTRYGVTDPALRRFRYGVQVNSLGLTEQQPENNVVRIVLEMLGVTLSADARARAIQLPAWNEALGLPREWDQQWSLRAQQVLAYETDLLEYPDLFAGSTVMDALTRDLAEAARAELDDVLALGGAFAAVEELKARLVASQAAARRAHRVRRAGRGRGQPLHRDAPTRRSLDAGRVGPDRRRGVRGAPGRRAARLARRARRRGGRRGARRAPARGRERRSRRQRHGAHARAGRGRGHDRRVGERPARGLRRLPRADRRARRRRARAARPSPPWSSAAGRSRRRAGARPSSWSPSPASTATPTAPSRSPSPRATPASRSSTPGSA